jgi:transaldolase
MRGVERRIDAGLNPDVSSVASVFVSRWDTAVAARAPESMHNQLGIAVAKRTYATYRSLLASARWQRIFNEGARPQRLLFASTGTKDPKASDILYVKALALPFSVNTMPEGTLQALAGYDQLGETVSADGVPDGHDADEMVANFADAGIDIQALAVQLQDDGAKAFVKSWNELMSVIESKQSKAA